jgi:simple sugar transport system ATP-binding protein
VTDSVQMLDISMAFGQNQVLRGVNLSIQGGKVTALLGANGAGKSTLIKILSGLYPEHGGSVIINGQPAELSYPRKAKAQGIQTVHQRIDEAVVPGLSVAENLLFEKISSRHSGRVGSVSSLLPEAKKIAASLELDWDDRFLRKDVYELDIADQQLLTLARAVFDNPKLLVLDEPTSALSAKEVDNLMRVIRSLRDSGVGILYVSHRLGEIDTIADELVVLRDGVIRGEQSRPFDWNEALTMMLGEETQNDIENNTDLRGSKEILHLTGVQLFPRSATFDLGIRSGEVTGVIGLLGSGKTEIAETLFGARSKTAQEMTLDGEPFRPSHPAEAIKKGVYLVPEDRAKESMFSEWSIARTVALPFLQLASRGWIVEPAKEKELGSRVIDEFQVIAQSPDQPVDSLSGGNQQKVIVGRWMQRDPRLLILDEPFRGVDIGARRTIANKASDLAEAGKAVIVLTSEVDELLEVADRVIVLVDGSPVLDTYLADSSREEIVQAMSHVA